MPDESLTMRATVIAGQRYADDYAVIWRGMWIGRILRGAGAPHGTPPWSWSCHLPGRPQGNDDRGNAVDLDDAKQQFKAHGRASARACPKPTSREAHRIAEISAEAFARYDRKRRA